MQSEHSRPTENEKMGAQILDQVPGEKIRFDQETQTTKCSFFSEIREKKCTE